MAFFSFRIPLGSRSRGPSITIHQHIRSGSSCSGCGCLIILAAGFFIWLAVREKPTQKPQPSPSMQAKPTAAQIATDPQAKSNFIASLPPATRKFVEDVRNAPPPEHYEKLLIVEKAKEYVSPKLKDPKTFELKEVEHRQHETGDFHVVRFTADGRKLRVGVRIADDGTISIIDKTKLPALLKSSKPAAK